MENQDIRWVQRFSNFKKAFAKLDEAVRKIETDFQRDAEGRIDADKFLNDIIKEGIIHRFEYTHELAWDMLQDFLSDMGNVQLFGSEDAAREAFVALISDGDVWMDMIESRKKTPHTYKEQTADGIFLKIVDVYHAEFTAFHDKMGELISHLSNLSS